MFRCDPLRPRYPKLVPPPLGVEGAAPSFGGGAAVSVVAVVSDLVDVPVADATRAAVSRCPHQPLNRDPISSSSARERDS